MVTSKTRGGFTLLELMLVIAIMAVLGSVIIGSVRYVARIAREKRAKVTAKVLETAISRYHAEYNVWPGVKAGASGEVEIDGPENKDVFGPMRLKSPKNPNGTRFFDETTLFTASSTDGALTRMSDSPDKERDLPIAFANKNTSKARFFKVKFDLNQNTVEIETPGLNDDADEFDFSSDYGDKDEEEQDQGVIEDPIGD